MTATLNTSEVTPAPAGPPRSFLLSLAAVLGVGPFAIDMYLASLPEIGAEFAAPSWMVQLTLTGYLIMLGAGQLVAGPVTDAFGRRRPLLLGLTIFIAACLLAAAAPSMAVLVVARMLQGAGAAMAFVVVRREAESQVLRAFETKGGGHGGLGVVPTNRHPRPLPELLPPTPPSGAASPATDEHVGG